MEDIRINRKEVLRYLGYRGATPDAQTEALIDACVRKTKQAAKPLHTGSRVPIEWIDAADGRMNLGRMEVESRDLARNLKGCSEVYMFAATLGLGIDMLIKRTRLKSTAEAAVLQAVSGAYAEAYAEAINDAIDEMISSEGLYTRPRYSPGFGDFGLKYQPAFLAVLAADRKIGIRLTNGYLMIPSKSVTALVGISAKPKER